MAVFSSTSQFFLKGFWRWSVTLRITWFMDMDFLQRLVAAYLKKTLISGRDRRLYSLKNIRQCKKVVKVTLVQALTLCTGRTAHRGSRGITLLFHDHGTRRGWGVSVTPRPLFTPEKDPVPIVQEAGWAPGPVWTGAENLAPTRIQSPDRPARSQSLYRLSYRAHIRNCTSPQNK